MMVDNGEVLQTIEQANPAPAQDVGAATVPVNKAGDVSRSFLGGFALFVFAKSANQAGALALLRSLYEKEWYTRYLVNTNGASLPVVQATASADYYRTNEHLRTMVTQLSTAVRYGGPDYGNTPWTGEAEGKLLFSQPVVEVVNGKKSVEQALGRHDGRAQDARQAVAPTTRGEPRRTQQAVRVPRRVLARWLARPEAPRPRPPAHRSPIPQRRSP